jgi:hypothetical protein
MTVLWPGTFNGTDRFTIERCLGEGGFGIVYQVFDRERNARVALKTLRHMDAGALYRLKREFRALTDLSHPNLASLYELLSDGEQWFLTMELVDGQDFLAYVRGEPLLPHEVHVSGSSITSADLAAANAETGSAGPTPARLRTALTPDGLERLRRATAQLARGLHYLHSSGKLHRDVKPSNVLVTREGRVVLLDFGLVAELGARRDGEGAEISGTPAYMAPELATTDPITEASDWYSVGVMLFEALTGTVPFSGSFFEVLLAKQSRSSLEPRQLVPAVPAALNDVCRHLLSRDPAERLWGAATLVTDDMADPAAPASPASAPFVGRAAQLAALDAAYEVSRQGRPVTMYVHGSSGMGKSALVRRFIQGVRDRDPEAVVLEGRCCERESVPYKALDSIVDGLTQYLAGLPDGRVEVFLPRDILALARVFPVLRRVEAIVQSRQRGLDVPDSHELRRRAFTAFRELMSRLASHHPLVLFIDDLQWGDADSVALLTELLEPPDPPALLLVAAYRTEEATSSEPLRMLLATKETSAAAVRELVVGELTADEARTLAHALMNERERATWSTDVLVGEAGGNPYFIDQLVRYGRSAAQSQDDARRQLTPHSDSVADVKLDDVIGARVGRLSPEARRLLEVLAVFGQPLELSVATRAAGIESRELEALGTLRTERLSRTRVTRSGEAIETYHDRIRETVLTRLEPAALTAHHRSLALTLEASGAADPEALAVHFSGAGDPERAAGYAVAAADRAAEALAFDRAARLYRLALDLVPGQKASQSQTRTKLGDALANGGRGREAAHAYLAAVEGATAADRLDLQRRAAEQLLRSGHIDEGFEAVRVVLASMGMKLAASPRRALLSMLYHRLYVRLRGLGFRTRDVSQIAAEVLVRIDACWSVAMGLGIVDHIRGADFQARHLLLALRTGEPGRITRALAIEVAYTAARGGARARRRSAELGDVAQRLAEELNAPQALGLVEVARGTAAALLGDWKRALELCDRSEAILRDRCTGVGWELAIAHLYSLLSLYFLGDLPELSRRLPILIKDAKERDDLNAVTNLRTRFSYLMWLAADDPEQARREVESGLDGWYDQGYTAQHSFDLHGGAETRLYTGDGPGAWAHVERHWAGLERSLLLRVQGICIEALSVRARSAIAAAGQASDGDGRMPLVRAAERAVRRLGAMDAPHAAPLAALASAGLASVTRQDDWARRCLDEAVRGFESVEMALYLAAARRRRGEIEGGESGAARASEADAWMQAHGIRNPERMCAVLAPGHYRTATRA